MYHIPERLCAMKASEITPEIRAAERAFRLTASVLAALMLACAAATVVSLLTRLVADWRPGYLVGVCFLVSLDTFYNHHRFKQIDLFSREWFVAAGAQIVLLLIGLRVVIGVSHGFSAFWGEVTAGWRSFLDSFLTVEYLLALGLCVLTWMITLGFASLFDEMGIDAELIRMEGYAMTPGESRSPRERLLQMVFGLGTALIVITALLRLDFRATQSGNWAGAVLELPALSNGGGSTLLYFLLGLALFSLTQFLDLHNRWSINRIPVSGGIFRRWAFYSLLFLSLMAVLASLLPTSYSLGFLAALGYALDLLTYVLFFIVQFLAALVLLVLSLAAFLFGREPPAGRPELPDFQPNFLPPEVATGPTAPSPWLELAKSLLFWGVFLTILLFALLQFVRQHQDILTFLRGRPRLAWLVVWWERLRALWKIAEKEIRQTVMTGLERLRSARKADTASPGWLNLRRLTPRQRVFFYYLAFVRRSEESGLPRAPSQTPAEFAARFDTVLPESEPDIEALTAAFVEARYAPHPVAPQKANRVREVWEHLKKEIRKRLMSRSA